MAKGSKGEAALLDDRDEAARKAAGRTAAARPEAPVAAALPAGFRLFEYRIDHVLGQGGFGIAYKATDVNLASKVVIKEYFPESFAHRSEDATVQTGDAHDRTFYENGLDSFLVEARTLATFRHPHIVRVARFFEAHNTAYMVLEYESGQSLKAWRTRQGGNIPEEAIVSLFAPLIDGLAVVHRNGYLHRDIKPDNIYVRDEDGSLVLLDFGAARQTATQKSDLGSVVTPGYGPIEQYADAVAQGPWTDIYSLGATLFWLVTGRKPIDAPSRLGDPDPLPSAEAMAKDRYSVEFLRAIDWALRLHPKDRPQDVDEFRLALFAGHPGMLGLHEALMRDGDETVGEPETLLETLRSPAAIKHRLRRFGHLLRRPGSWPLAVKMTIAMIATALAPMLITANYNFTSTRDYVGEVELRNLEQLASSTAGRISQVLLDSRHLADYVGTDDDFIVYLTKPTPAGTAAILSKLEGLVTANPDIQFAMAMDTAGNALVASDATVMGKNFQFRDYFKQAMQGQSYMTGIIVGSTRGAAGLYFARPVYSADAKSILGVVVLRIKAEPIARLLAVLKVDDDRIPFLIDSDGVIVWHPNEKIMFKSLAPLSSEKLKEIAADRRFQRATIESIDQPELAKAMIGAKDRGNVSYYSRADKRDEIAGFAPVPGHHWTVGVTESRAYFAEPLERLFQKVMLSVALAGVIFVALALLFARSIVEPIRKLTAAAHALKSGDYDRAHIAVRSDDEIGRLARTFNVMIDVLRQRERESGRVKRDSGKPDAPKPDAPKPEPAAPPEAKEAD